MGEAAAALPPPSESQSQLHPRPGITSQGSKVSKAGGDLVPQAIAASGAAPGSGGSEGRGLACAEVAFWPTGGRRLEAPIARAGGILVSGGQR